MNDTPHEIPDSLRPVPRQDGVGARRTADEASRTRSKILVLDDERLIRMTLGAKLRRIGFDPVAVASVQEALDLLRDGGCRKFRAIITDIVMEGMDGFVFRDIVRGLDPTIPLFFMTALDPEEGGGFLKRILEDPNSYYLPKSVKSEILLNRVRNIVASRSVEQVIEEQAEETRKAMDLAAQVQRSMLPVRTFIGEESFYTTWWHPKEEVSGDLYEVVPFGHGCALIVLGDVQGHGVSAALAMTAVQSQLRRFGHREGAPRIGPEEIANFLQRFFRENLADVSYMTALIAVYRPLERTVDWISCGAPDLAIHDPDLPDPPPVNPEKRGGLPIGLFPGTEYGRGDVVRTELGERAVCVMHTDGVLDISRDPEGVERLPDEERLRMVSDLVLDARREASMVAAPYKFLEACRAMGYVHFCDDVTELVFGANWLPEGTFLGAVPLDAASIDRTARQIEEWGGLRGWDAGLSTRVQLVFEEKLMNVYEHGFEYRQRLRETAVVRVRERGGEILLTVWDCGTPDPSMAVAVGSTDVAFDLANQRFSDGGRGRLMVRNLCRGIERNRFGTLNETTYHIPVEN